jgi:hypothetical protein
MHRIQHAALLGLGWLVVGTSQAQANDFPTSARVLYVHECMRNNPGPHFEMVSKCSCVLDKIADDIKFEEFETMSTVSNAVSIGGERGGTLRDNETLKPQVARWRAVQAKAQASCFINAGPR